MIDQPILGLRNFNQPYIRWAHTQRLQLLSKGQDIAPVTFDIDPISVCNHCCPWCLDAQHTSAILPLSTLRRFANELSQFEINGTRTLGVIFKGGGEPTLHPEFPEVVELFGSAGLELGVITNGSRLMDRAIRDALLHYASFVRVSLDAKDAQSHEISHSSTDYADIIRGIELLSNSRKNKNPEVGITCVVNPGEQDIQGYIDNAEMLGVDYVQLRLPYGEEVGFQPAVSRMDWEKTYYSLMRVTRKMTDRGLKIVIGDYIPPWLARKIGKSQDLPFERVQKRCLAHKMTAILAADGSVFGCCEHRTIPNYRFGTIDYSNNRDLASIWGASRRAEKLAKMNGAECLKICTHPVTIYNEAIQQIKCANHSSALAFS